MEGVFPLNELIIVILLLSFAVSFDSYFFGLTYSLRSIHLSYTTYGIVIIMTMLSFITGNFIGQSISFFIPSVTDILGSIIFVMIGSYIVYQWVTEQKQKIKNYKLYYRLKSINLKTLFQILKSPQMADLDQSGHIIGKESMIVAVALSIDSFGIGIGSAFTDLPVILTGVMISFSSFFFLTFGYITGKWLQKCKWINSFTFLPGIILICLGIWNLMK